MRSRSGICSPREADARRSPPLAVDRLQHRPGPQSQESLSLALGLTALSDGHRERKIVVKQRRPVFRPVTLRCSEAKRLLMGAMIAAVVLLIAVRAFG